MKKIITILLLLWPTLSLASSLTDIEDSPYELAVKFFEYRGVIEGYDDNTYKPDNTINRAEFLKVLVESRFPGAAGEENNCFSDVGNEWFAKYICYAEESGIISGYPDGSFKPEQKINLAEALKIVLETYDVQIDSEAGENWYDPYYLLSLEKNWLEDIDESITHDVTRGEMAKLAFTTTMVKENDNKLLVAEALASCTEYEDTFIHLLTGEDMTREITSIEDNLCHYYEEMPNGGEMNCQYTEEARESVAQYYIDLAEADTQSFSISITLEGASSTYTIDGIEVENPLQEATDNGMCVVSGY
ncbi:MAG: S-layer homology domain-containing protein [Patescibacteria group bacterium]|nr:S-layer homology domain-containing protein [Patescibacteria group bacterium]